MLRELEPCLDAKITSFPEFLGLYVNINSLYNEQMVVIDEARKEGLPPQIDSRGFNGTEQRGQGQLGFDTVRKQGNMTYTFFSLNFVVVYGTGQSFISFIV